MELEVEGFVGVGLVIVCLNGKGDMKGFMIDLFFLKEDEGEILEDLILVVYIDVKVKLEVLL